MQTCMCVHTFKPNQGSIPPLLLQARGLCPSRRLASALSAPQRGQSHRGGTQLQKPGPETGHTRTIHGFKLRNLYTMVICLFLGYDCFCLVKTIDDTMV